MAIGKASDLQVYQPFFQAGWYEGTAQYADLFNAASGNTIRMVTSNRIGDYFNEAFWKQISGLITRIDRTSTSTVTPLAMASGEKTTVKLDSKVGPVAMTADSYLKIGQNPEQMLFDLGVQVGIEQQVWVFNKAVIAVEAAITGTAASLYDATSQSTKTMIHKHLANGLKTQGDRSNEIRAWLFHGTPYHDLMIQSITDNVFDVGGVTVNMGTVATLGRRAVVSDATALLDTTTTSTADTYHTLGLRENAVVIENSQVPVIAFEGPITGAEQIYYQYQAEFSVNVGVRGYTWDKTNGGANPTDATLGTTTNWDLTVSNQKLAAGCAVLTQ